MPHSVMVMLGGFALLAVMILLGKKEDRGMNALRFIPMWLALSIVNLVIGVWWAGYGLQEELLILLMIFGIPAAAALLTARLTRNQT
mgnify:CR=1 FL=1